MQRRLRNGTLIECLAVGSRVTLPDGAVVEGAPHDTDAYRATSERLGYGDDTLQLCRDHDPLHAIVAAVFGLGASYSLAVAAGLRPADALSSAEEEVVLAVQKFVRLCAVSIFDVGKRDIYS